MGECLARPLASLCFDDRVDPAVAVVVPTFRREDLVLEAVASALDQDGVTVEVVVVDDSPEGSARSALRQIEDSRIRYVPSSAPRHGPAAARNQGWRASGAGAVVFLDDDDRLVPGALGNLHRRLLETGAGAVFGRVAPFGDDDAMVDAERRYFESAAALARRARNRMQLVACLLYRDAVLVNSGTMVRRACLDAVGGYDPEQPVNEDAELYSRVIRRYGHAFLDEPVVHRRVASTSLVHEREAQLPEAYRRMRGRYRSCHGAAELVALRILAATI